MTDLGIVILIVGATAAVLAGLIVTYLSHLADQTPRPGRSAYLPGMKPSR